MAGALVTSVVVTLLAYSVARGLGLLGSTVSVAEVALSFSVTSAVLLGWTFLACRRKGSGSLRDDFGWAWRPVDPFLGVGAAIVGMVGLVVISAVLGDATGDPTFEALDPRGFAEVVVLALTVAVAAPIVEEIFFRGLFLRSAERRFGVTAGVIVTSAVFALLHIPQRADLGFFPAFVPLFFLGVLLGALAAATRRLGPSIVAHMTINGFGVIALLAERT